MPKPSQPSPTYNPADDPLLTLDEVAAYLKVHRTTIRRRLNASTFPAPKLLGESQRWPRSVINAWITAQPDGVGA